FDFLSQESSFDVQFSLIEYSGSDSYSRAFLVGLLNTLLVSFISIIICTILGVIIGVARLSSNYLIKNSAAWYVEFFRNIPLLLQIFFWYYAALRALPMPEKANAWFGVTYMTVKGYYIPSMVWENLNVFLYCGLAAIISIIVLRNYASKLRDTQGKQIPVLLYSLALLIVLPLLSFLFGGVSLGFELPELKKLSKISYIYEGGISLPPELIALVLALSLYTSTFVAECVRAGIEGVSKGQLEKHGNKSLIHYIQLKKIEHQMKTLVIKNQNQNQYLYYPYWSVHSGLKTQK
ncbi:ABC transporter permease subunit, partial [Pelagibacterales bacterium SAG-MED34]|nr:ABC transporter permease subunit [Pelagibacterales bacterium SAG-MED34]